MKHNGDSPVSRILQNDLVHCPICTHNVLAGVEIVNKRIRVVAGQKCPRCHSFLDAAAVLPQLEAA